MSSIHFEFRKCFLKAFKVISEPFKKIALSFKSSENLLSSLISHDENPIWLEFRFKIENIHNSTTVACGSCQFWTRFRNQFQLNDVKWCKRMIESDVQWIRKRSKRSKANWILFNFLRTISSFGFTLMLARFPRDNMNLKYPFKFQSLFK